MSERNQNEDSGQQNDNEFDNQPSASNARGASRRPAGQLEWQADLGKQRHDHASREQRSSVNCRQKRRRKLAATSSEPQGSGSSEYLQEERRSGIRVRRRRAGRRRIRVRIEDEEPRPASAEPRKRHRRVERQQRLTLELCAEAPRPLPRGAALLYQAGVRARKAVSRSIHGAKLGRARMRSTKARARHARAGVELWRSDGRNWRTGSRRRCRRASGGRRPDSRSSLGTTRLEIVEDRRQLVALGGVGGLLVARAAQEARRDDAVEEDLGPAGDRIVSANSSNQMVFPRAGDRPGSAPARGAWPRDNG